jgi:hypothetical protein
MVGLVIGVVCVAVMTLLLLGTSIVEPKLIHYYDVGVVCAACYLALCVFSAWSMTVVSLIRLSVLLTPPPCISWISLFFALRLASLYSFVMFVVHVDWRL